MARTSITTIQLTGSYSYSAVTASAVAADASNGNQASLAGGEIILARNSGGTTRTITIVSANDPFNRVRDISVSILAGETKAFGPFGVLGWRQTDGQIYFSADHADVLFTVLTPLH